MTGFKWKQPTNSQMNNLHLNDSTLVLNSKLSESLVIMDTTGNDSEHLRKKKIKKSINLNLETQPSIPLKSSNLNETPERILKKCHSDDIQSPKGTFKKSHNDVVHETGTDYYQKLQEPSSVIAPRPRNLEQLVKSESLLDNTMKSSFNLEELGDDDELYLLEVPKSINPELLKGQHLSLTDKSKLRIGEIRYTSSCWEPKGSLSFVLRTEKNSAPYKTVNIKPAGIVHIRQKLVAMPRIIPECIPETKIPLPENIRIRDPYFGVVNTVTNIKTETESKNKR